MYSTVLLLQDTNKLAYLRCKQRAIKLLNGPLTYEVCSQLFLWTAPKERKSVRKKEKKRKKKATAP